MVAGRVWRSGEPGARRGSAAPPAGHVVRRTGTTSARRGRRRRRRTARSVRASPTTPAATGRGGRSSATAGGPRWGTPDWASGAGDRGVALSQQKRPVAPARGAPPGAPPAGAGAPRPEGGDVPEVRARAVKGPLTRWCPGGGHDPEVEGLRSGQTGTHNRRRAPEARTRRRSRPAPPRSVSRCQPRTKSGAPERGAVPARLGRAAGEFARPRRPRPAWPRRRRPGAARARWRSRKRGSQSWRTTARSTGRWPGLGVERREGHRAGRGAGARPAGGRGPARPPGGRRARRPIGAPGPQPRPRRRQLPISTARDRRGARLWHPALGRDYSLEPGGGGGGEKQVRRRRALLAGPSLGLALGGQHRAGGRSRAGPPPPPRAGRAPSGRWSRPRRGSGRLARQSAGRRH